MTVGWTSRPVGCCTVHIACHCTWIREASERGPKGGGYLTIEADGSRRETCRALSDWSGQTETVGEPHRWNTDRERLLLKR